MNFGTFHQNEMQLTVQVNHWWERESRPKFIEISAELHQLLTIKIAMTDNLCKTHKGSSNLLQMPFDRDLPPTQG